MIAALAVFSLQTAPHRDVLAEAPTQGDRARELFERGVEAADRGALSEAIELLDESFELFPHPATLLNLALFRERAERPLDAFVTYRELMVRYGTVISEQTRTRVEARLASLEGRLAAVTVETTPSGASILIDGRVVGVSPTRPPHFLEPGEHVIEASLEAHETMSVRRDLRPGQRLDVSLPLPTIERPTLIIESSTPAARAALDDGPLEPLPLRRALAPGPVSLRVAARGHEPHRRVVEIPQSGELRVAVDLQPVTSATPAREPGFWRGPWPWIIGGLVVSGALGVGLGVGLSGRDDHSEATWTIRTP